MEHGGHGVTTSISGTPTARAGGGGGGSGIQSDWWIQVEVVVEVDWCNHGQELEQQILVVAVVELVWCQCRWSRRFRYSNNKVQISIIMTSKIKVDNIENQCGGAVVTKCGATTTISGSVVKADDIQAADGGNLINQCGQQLH